jgi:hypothetical protein
MREAERPISDTLESFKEKILSVVKPETRRAHARRNLEATV